MSKKISTILSSNVNATSVANIAGGGATSRSPIAGTGTAGQGFQGGTSTGFASGGGAGAFATATAGTANTGGGGGGSRNDPYLGGNGGSGVVILAIPTASYTGTKTGSPVVTTSGANTILTFNISGTYTS